MSESEDVNNNDIKEEDISEVCVVVAGSVDSGKCFAERTKIMLSTGKITNVEDIKVGDLLMGDNSKPRKVLETHTGKGMLYEIIPNNRERYFVNGEHILSLKYSSVGDKKQYLKKFFDKHGISINDNVVNISVKQFISLDKKYQLMLKWYRKLIEFEPKKVNINPYYYGIWLGNILNNNNNNNNIFRQSIENYVSNYKNGYTSILDEFKYNSKNIRLQVLSGIIDSNEYNQNMDNKYCIQITESKCNNLITDIIYLSMSLGYECDNITTHKEHYLHIYGKEDIPSLFVKNIKPFYSHDNLETNISIVEYKIDKYYGFETDGNHRFLLGDFSVAHNSTFLGVMVNKELDDGNGLARKQIAKHPHEIVSGKTSDTVSHTTMISPYKRIIYVDLCGHEKYLRTTISGLTGYFPDYGILIVAANRGILRMTKEHLGLYLYLEIPFIVLIARVDIAPKGIYDRTIKTLNKILKKYKKKPIFINNIEEQKLDKDKQQNIINGNMVKVKKYANTLQSNKFIVPIISVSNKTGYYLEVVKELLGNLKPRKLWEDIDYSIFYIDTVYKPKGIGFVVAGTLKGKSFNVNSDMYLGPYDNKFIKVKIWSIHNNTRTSIPYIMNKRHGCLAFRVYDKKIKLERSKINKGVIMISDLEKAKNICYKFKAEIKILHHSTFITEKFESVVHCNTVKQMARIILDEKQNLKTGDMAQVSFIFKHKPEFIEEGSNFVFREGTTRGIGTVKKIVPLGDEDK